MRGRQIKYNHAFAIAEKRLAGAWLRTAVRSYILKEENPDDE
jgi:hypothetical protein